MLRVLAAMSAALVAAATLVGSAGYAAWLRSDAYRLQSAQRLADYLELPSEIAAVIPRSSSTRQFNGVAIYLPDRRDRVLFCDEALLRRTPAPGRPDDYEIELRRGTAEISTRTWLREDYRRLLESGLRPSFDPGGPRRVTFTGMDVHFARDQFHLRLDDAAGVVEFPDDAHGRARVQCRSLNGRDTAGFVTLASEFSPRNGGIRVDRVQLSTPRLPLSILRLSDLLAAPIETGDFQGSLAYFESDGQRAIELSGSCYDVDLAEWSRAISHSPWRGACPDLELLECRVVNRALQRVRFRGALKNVELGDLLAPFGLADVGARATLRVDDAQLGPDGIQHLSAAGECRRVSLDALTRRLGWGEMTGVVDLVIRSLEIRDNRLAELDATLIVDDAFDPPNRISRRLLTEVISRALHFTIPPILPDSIAYTHFGVRIDVRDESLRLFGTHGPREKTILTVRAGGADIPLIHEPDAPIDLTPWLDPARAAMLDNLRARLSAGAATNATP